MNVTSSPSGLRAKVAIPQLAELFTRLPGHGRLGFRPEWLYPFTTLTDVTRHPAAELVEKYGGRWQIELNRRHRKAQMNLKQLEVTSAHIEIKPWSAGLLAYPLIRGVRLWAARRRRGGGEPLGVVLRPHAAAAGAHAARPAEPRRQRPVPRAFPVLRGSRAAARVRRAEEQLKS